MPGYRARTLLMASCALLGYHVLRDDRSLQRSLQREKASLDLVSERLRLDLAELRARQSRLSTAAQNLTAAFSAAECRRRMPLLQQTSVVYTWVNGSDPQYRELRKKHGGAGVVGGARDRTIEELRYSIRSLIKYLPWLQGHIYIVSPNQHPSWLVHDSPRITVVDQDSLFSPEDAELALPTFNTNAIEPNLWRIPGLTEVFLHINDDYLFGAPIAPEDFFGVGCAGLRLFFEENIIKRPRSSGSHLGIWKRAVLSSRLALDTSAVAQRPTAVSARRWRPYTDAAPEGDAWGGRYYYLKHAPFVYSRSVMRVMSTLFRDQIVKTYPHKFRNGDDVITPLLHHGVAAALETAMLVAQDERPPHNATAAEAEAWKMPSELALSLAANMSRGWYGENATAEGDGGGWALAGGEGKVPHFVEVETVVGNAVLLQSGSKAGFFLCHLRDRPVSCELLEGTGQTLYDNILGKPQARFPSRNAVRLSNAKRLLGRQRARSSGGATPSTTTATGTWRWRSSGASSRRRSCRSARPTRSTTRRASSRPYEIPLKG